MFDVIHALYEEDITPLWEEHIKVKDRVREALYPLMYGRPYKFATTTTTNGTEGQELGEGLDHAGPAESKAVKPYIPPTSEEDLMKLLGPPTGG